MPAPKGNQYAAHTDDHRDAQITLRVPAVLKRLAVRCARQINSKLSPFITDAIREKVEREEKIEPKPLLGKPYGPVVREEGSRGL